MRSEALTEPGCAHDLCATVFSTALASPFLKTLPLTEHGLQFAHPEAPFAHPLDDGRRRGLTITKARGVTDLVY